MLIERDLKPRDIVTPRAIDNAFALDMAMGGSTNTVLHTLALAREGGIDYPLARLNEVAARVPHLCKVSPAVPDVHIEDVHRAGGISAILAEMARKPGTLWLDEMTVTGQTLGENIAGATIAGPARRAHDRGALLAARAGCAILFGNLAPGGRGRQGRRGRPRDVDATAARR